MHDENKYWYEACITEVYDGDTVTAVVNLGFDIDITMKLRLYGINAPEVRGEQQELGIKARDWLREQVLGEVVIINTIKDKKDKYGRYLADIYYSNGMIGSSIPESINNLLVKNGLAEEKEY